MESLASVLAYLESNNPVMVIDQIDISPVRSVRNTSSLANNSQLNVNFKIFSFMRIKT
jgi:general secretion pathway protein M